MVPVSVESRKREQERRIWQRKGGSVSQRRVYGEGVSPKGVDRLDFIGRGSDNETG